MSEVYWNVTCHMVEWVGYDNITREERWAL